MRYMIVFMDDKGFYTCFPMHGVTKAGQAIEHAKDYARHWGGWYDVLYKDIGGTYRVLVSEDENATQ